MGLVRRLGREKWKQLFSHFLLSTLTTVNPQVRQEATPSSPENTAPLNWHEGHVKKVIFRRENPAWR